MIPNPILKVLSTFQKHKVKALLIGGQACIIYGADGLRTELEQLRWTILKTR